jgi:hypothetical protein
MEAAEEVHDLVALAAGGGAGRRDSARASQVLARGVAGG